MQNVIAEAVARKSQKIENLMAELKGELASLGLDFTIQIGSETLVSETNTASKPKSKKAAGVKAFWKKLRKIAAEKNITVAEAREVYNSEKTAKPVGVRGRKKAA